MNILTLYISKNNQDCFEEFLMIFCEKINNIFYYNDFYIDVNEYILNELDYDEIINIKNHINDFIAYSIVWNNLHSLYDLLKKINLDISFLIDNDNEGVIKNDDFISMSLDDFAKWVRF
ncbi:hypothetical protein LU293_00035 [Moraxella nasovis]|uniref:hypothetical protein n=1 Tax=Moraxella nasovis TaxID=2904121 RepID=UPI001F61EF12|nr:hypothetical protein [Moraxella nasovis]UNU73342.1 hypothetical protein LU293_00035 [Moraxella nasovis]